MTNEEAKAIIRKEYLCVDRDCDIERSCGRCDLMIPSKEPILEAFRMAMDLLDRNATTKDCLGVDAISRQAVLDSLVWYNDANNLNAVKTIEMIQALPSVNPTKTGHWIETAEEYYKAINEKGGGVDENTPYFVDDIACSECLSKFSVIDNETERFDFCPNCGARMESAE